MKLNHLPSDHIQLLSIFNSPFRLPDLTLLDFLEEELNVLNIIIELIQILFSLLTMLMVTALDVHMI